MGWINTKNGVPLCKGCHRFYGPHATDYAAQKRFNEWVRSYLSARGVNYCDLEILCKSRGKVYLSEFPILLDMLNKELASS
jgi:hypothetical protein